MPAEPAMQQQVHALYHDHHGWLHDWLRKKLGNSCEAADLAHDTFVRVMASRKTAFGASPRAFLTHVAKGLVVDHWRRRDVERAYLDVIARLPEPQAPSPESRLLILEALQHIVTMLDTLPLRTRAMFLLAQLDGLPYAEIAVRFGTSLPTVKRHIRAGFIACMVAADAP